MKRNLLQGSLLLLGLSVLFWLALTFFESALVDTPLSMQRLLTFILLVLPTAIGVLLGVMSLIRKEGRAGLAILSIVFNALFALFNLMIILFAG